MIISTDSHHDHTRPPIVIEIEVKMVMEIIIKTAIGMVIEMNQYRVERGVKWVT